MELTHIIGPKTGHSYEKNAKAEINRRLDLLAARGRDPLPRAVRMVTHSLRYNTQAWVSVEGMGQHWEPARVEARLSVDDNEISVTATNVTALRFSIPSGLCPFEPNVPVTVSINGDKVTTIGTWAKWAASVKELSKAGSVLNNNKACSWPCNMWAAFNPDGPGSALTTWAPTVLAASPKKPTVALV